MDTGIVAERFIRAAEIEFRMPKDGERPRGYRGSSLPVIHTFEDKLGWRKERGDQLVPGDDPLAEERRHFTEGRRRGASAEDVDIWETCLRWTVEFVDGPAERRALWAWAFAKAGGKPFARWCFKVEGVHAETGRRRKNRALARISTRLQAGEDCPEAETDDASLAVADPGGLTVSAVDDAAGDRPPGNSWMAAGAFTRDFASDCDFSWSQRRNELRRQRLAAKRRESEAEASAPGSR